MDKGDTRAIAPRRRPGRAAVIGFLLLGLAAAAGAGQQDFKLKDMDGNAFRLADHRGEVVYVTFWATWCVPCRRELPLLESMYAELKDRGLLVIGVNTDPAANKSKIKPFVNQYKFSFPTVLDPDNNVHDTYNPTRELPYGLLIDREGNLHKTYAGYRTGDEELLREDILKLLGDAEGAAGAAAGEPGAAQDE
ncbi:MAG TPA: TlpA disulfide reductase family protein [Thermoanaerobaculales bacterium]|nr:TlpA disulfide reductase family protein [Thermoanaerobaculales bacterium]